MLLAKRIRESVQFPPGYYIQWAGQLNINNEPSNGFWYIGPFTRCYFRFDLLNTKSVVKTAIVLLAVPFS